MDWFDEEEDRAAKSVVKTLIFIAVIAVIAACVVKYF